MNGTDLAAALDRGAQALGVALADVQRTQLLDIGVRVLRQPLGQGGIVRGRVN